MESRRDPLIIVIMEINERDQETITRITKKGIENESASRKERKSRTSHSKTSDERDFTLSGYASFPSKQQLLYFFFIISFLPSSSFSFVQTRL
jgi:hypothetical protein